jgi:hypothetical protein
MAVARRRRRSPPSPIRLRSPPGWRRQTYAVGTTGSTGAAGSTGSSVSMTEAGVEAPEEGLHARPVVPEDEFAAPIGVRPPQGAAQEMLEKSPLQTSSPPPHGLVGHWHGGPAQ